MSLLDAEMFLVKDRGVIYCMLRAIVITTHFLLLSYTDSYFPINNVRIGKQM